MIDHFVPGPVVGQNWRELNHDQSIVANIETGQFDVFYGEDEDGDWMFLEINRETNPALWRYVGELAQDDFISWSGGDNPAPNRDVTVRYRDGLESVFFSNDLDWRHDIGSPGASDIIAFLTLRESGE